MPNLDGTGPMGRGARTGRGLGRPPLCRRVSINPDVRYFKPRGIPLVELEEVELLLEEMEAIRLRNIECLEQTDAADQMKTSQSTYQRILCSAYRKITEALIEGKAIKISGK